MQQEDKPIMQKKKEDKEFQYFENLDSAYIKGAIESIIFLSPKVITLKQIYKALPNVAHDIIDICISELMHEYKIRNGGMLIVKDEENIEMVVKPEYSSFNSFSSGAALSKGELKTLAYISLNTPVMQSKITGKRPFEHIQKLKDLNLVAIQKKGRKNLLITTNKFEMLYPNSKKKKK